MLRKIKDNLGRQKEALRCLLELLQEEFSLLMSGQPQSVSQQELAIQELMRQIANERYELKNLLAELVPGKPRRLADLVQTMPEGLRGPMEELLAGIDRAEQECARQSEQNYQLALALFDQNKALFDTIMSEITPKRTNLYSARGRYQKADQQASLFSGRL